MLKRQGHNHHNYTVPTTDSKRRQTQHLRYSVSDAVATYYLYMKAGHTPSQCWLHPPSDALTRCLSTSTTSSSPCAPSFPTAGTLKDERRWWHQAVKETEHVQHDLQHLQWFKRYFWCLMMPYGSVIVIVIESVKRLWLKNGEIDLIFRDPGIHRDLFFHDCMNEVEYRMK